MQLWHAIVLFLLAYIPLKSPNPLSRDLLLGFTLGLLVASTGLVGALIRNLLALRMTGGDSEVYPSLDHLLLNLSVGTAWLNMGFWEVWLQGERIVHRMTAARIRRTFLLLVKVSD
jgi:hypothetical protein